MSARIERVLARLSAPGAILARERLGAQYGVFPGGDRRRRPLARIDAESVRRLCGDGVLQACDGDAFTLSQAGEARRRRESAAAGESYLAQHAVMEDRAVADAEGGVRRVRGVAASTVVRRLAALRDGAGGAWLTEAEVAAAEALRADWERSQRGLVRGSDWSAPPLGSSPRVGNAQERALAARCDAGRRTAEAMALLAPPLRRVVERVCLHEEGLEALERAEHWPARSGKLALKLGLAQLALVMR